MIDAWTSPEVLAVVEQHVHEGKTHFARCPKFPGVIPLAPHRAPAVAGTVDSACAANSEALKAAYQRARRIRFDEKMQMIRLDGELSHA